MRARSFALRDRYPHVLQGLICAEEAQDYSDPPTDNPKLPPPVKMATDEQLSQIFDMSQYRCISDDQRRKIDNAMDSLTWNQAVKYIQAHFSH